MAKGSYIGLSRLDGSNRLAAMHVQGRTPHRVLSNQSKSPAHDKERRKRREQRSTDRKGSNYVEK